MRIRKGFAVGLVVVLGASAVPAADVAAGGGAAVGVASEAGSPAQQRVRERRRERQGRRQWIQVPELSPAEALPLVGAPGVAIIDVTCRERRGDLSVRLPGAVWEDCTQVERWAPRYAEVKTLLVYCACKDKPKSARVVQQLRKMGFGNAYHLTGDWFAWRDAGYPVEAKPADWGGGPLEEAGTAGRSPESGRAGE
jgi:rhodanese-related sulfurtransferase